VAGTDAEETAMGCRPALTAAACLAGLALAACTSTAETAGTTGSRPPAAIGAASFPAPTTAPPTARPPALVYPTSADAYTALLVKAWQHDDVASMTALAGPNVAAHLNGLLPPTTVEPFEDAEDSGRTAVHLVGQQKGLGIDITVEYVDSGFGKPHAIVDIIDNNVEQTISG
jgi:hypothetical protein